VGRRLAILRPVTLTDLLQIYKINTSVQSSPWSKKAIEDELTNSASKGWVTLDNVNITGYIFVRVTGDQLEILTLGVGYEHQRRGIARALIKHVLHILIEASEVILEVNENNIAALTLYKTLGFKIFNTRKNYYPDGSSALCMSLNPRL
jgi:ribosomal-protein-alanine N-acetyltransferase